MCSTPGFYMYLFTWFLHIFTCNHIGFNIIPHGFQHFFPQVGVIWKVTCFTFNYLLSHVNVLNSHLWSCFSYIAHFKHVFTCEFDMDQRLFMWFYPCEIMCMRSKSCEKCMTNVKSCISQGQNVFNNEKCFQITLLPNFLIFNQSCSAEENLNKCSMINLCSLTNHFSWSVKKQ